MSLKFKNVVIAFLSIIVILVVRYFIIMQYVVVKKERPIDENTLCFDCFELYENETPHLTIPEDAYSPLPPSISIENEIMEATFSVRNDAVLEYRINGTLIWASDDPQTIKWTKEYKSLCTNTIANNNSKTNSRIVSNEDFYLSLAPLSLWKNGEKIWDLDGWHEDFRLNATINDHPTGDVFLISENRHMQVSLLSNGDLVVVEKTSLSKPPIVKMSLLDIYCD